MHLPYIPRVVIAPIIVGQVVTMSRSAGMKRLQNYKKWGTPSHTWQTQITNENLQNWYCDVTKQVKSGQKPDEVIFSRLTLNDDPSGSCTWPSSGPSNACSICQVGWSQLLSTSAKYLSTTGHRRPFWRHLPLFWLVMEKDWKLEIMIVQDTVVSITIFTSLTSLFLTLCSPDTFLSCLLKLPYVAITCFI